MNFVLNASLYAGIVFIGILISLELGNRIGEKRADSDIKGIGAIEGAVFGLLGLMIAFTFSGAATRFEERRHLIVEEVNAIGTAWLRIDTLPVNTQPDLRKLFIDYMDTRAVAYQNVISVEDKQQRLAQTASLQQQIWTAAVTASQQPDARNQASMLMLPALNEMIDITTTRDIATKNHPPVVIFIMLGALTLITAFLAGFSMGGKAKEIRMHKLMFAVIITMTFYVTLDLEYPREGLIRIDAADQPIIDLRNSVAPVR